MVTVIFVICQVLYCFTLISILNVNKEKEFKGDEAKIGLMVNLRWFVVVFNGALLLCKLFNIDTYCLGSIGEWIAFEICFVMHSIIATVINYKERVVPAE